MINRTVGKRAVLLAVFASLCYAAAACGRDETPVVEKDSNIELSFTRSTTYVEVLDTVLLELNDADELALVLDSVQWSSEDTSVVVVQAFGGVITGVGEGATRIWARLGADSVSTVVVVEPRTEIFALNPREFSFDALGDLANLDLLSIGRDPLPEGDLAHYCTSTNPAVVVVRAGPTISSAGNGSAFVRCTIGHTTDSVLVRVRQRAVRIAIIEPRARPIGAERDSITLDIATIDRLGAPIFDVTPTWRSLNARIVQIDRETGVAFGVSAGSARIVAEYERFADTLRLQIGDVDEAETVAGLPRATVVGLDQEFATGDETETETDFYYDEFAEADIADTGVARTGPALLLEDERIAQTIAAQDTTPEITGPKKPAAVFAAVVGIADHRVDIGIGTEKTSGPVFGAEFELPFTRQLTMRGQAIAGKLSAGTSGIDDRTLTDFGATLSYDALSWGSLEIGSGIRSYTTTLATQRWSSIATGGRAHLEALDGLVSGHVNFAFLPLVSVSGIQSPSLGLQAGAGLGFRQRRLTAGLHYELERFSFPAQLGIQRIEQYAILRFRVGLALGGN